MLSNSFHCLKKIVTISTLISTERSPEARKIINFKPHYFQESHPIQRARSIRRWWFDVRSIAAKHTIQGRSLSVVVRSVTVSSLPSKYPPQTNRQPTIDNDDTVKQDTKKELKQHSTGCGLWWHGKYLIAALQRQIKSAFTQPVDHDGQRGGAARYGAIIVHNKSY